MTSLELFNSDPQAVDDFVKPGVDWGTAKLRSRVGNERSDEHAPGTFLYK